MASKLLKQAIAEKNKSKREIFEEIKAADPDLANWLVLINREFGKPSKVEVTIKGKKYL